MVDAWGGSWGTSWGSSWGGDAAAQEDILLGGGTYQGWRKKLAEEDTARDKRWNKRRRQLERLGDLIAGIKEEIPSDLPEAQVARAAEEAVEKAAERLVEDTPAPAFDYAGLAAAVMAAQQAVAQAEAAFEHYRARKQREMEEQDDEDVLLLMA